MQATIYEMPRLEPSMEPRREVKEEIARQVKAEMASQIEAMKPKGWRKLVFVLREFGPIVGSIGLLLALLGLAGAGWHYAFSRVRKEAEFETRTADRLKETGTELGKMQSTLDGIQAFLGKQFPHQAVRGISQLSPKDFRAALPILAKALETPPSKATATKETLYKLAANLRGLNESSPEYWPTVLRFISFASAGLSSNVPPRGEPQWIISKSFIPPGSARFPPIRHKVVRLDGGEISDMKFYNCRIEFTSNPVVMLNVVFIDCVFDMPPARNLTPYIRTTAKALLASNLTHVSLDYGVATHH